MKIITTKRGAGSMMENFSEVASYDAAGSKYYFSFRDKDREGKWTLMFYERENKWTVHGVGPTYCDDGETSLDDKQVVDFLYKNRKCVNVVIKEKSKIPASV